MLFLTSTSDKIQMLTGSNSGSIYFDGLTQQLTVASNASLPAGTGDFTIEFWMNHPSLTGYSNYPRIIQGDTVNSFQIYFSGATLTIASNGGTVTNTLNYTSYVNQWVHIAITRASGSISLWANGGLISTYNTTVITYVAPTTNFTIFQPQANGPRAYLSNFRIVLGVAVYTGTFTVPTIPLTATQSSGTNISAITGSQCSLLLNTVSGTNLDIYTDWVDNNNTSVTPNRTNSVVSNTSYLLDSSTFGYTVTATGSPTYSPYTPFTGITTTTDIVAAPAASTYRMVNHISVYNNSTINRHNIVIQHTDGTGIARLWSGNLSTGESIHYDSAIPNDTGWSKRVSGGTQIISNSNVNVQDFSTAGVYTWTKPTSFTPTMVYVQVWGAGGGGGGGGTTTAIAAIKTGGAGGGGGAFNEYLFRAGDLPQRVNITVGNGGRGGIGVSAAAGTAGTAGGASNFGGLVFAFGGGGGQAGAITAVAGSGGGGGGRGGAGAVGAAAASTGGLPLANAGTGAVSGSGAGGPITAVTTHNAEFGGGGGGGFVAAGNSGFGAGGSLRGGGGGGCGSCSASTGTSTGGYNGGLSGSYVAATGAAGNAAGAAGTAGTAGTSTYGGGGGGGGGSTATLNVAGAAGGDGGLGGGGAGGGGCGSGTGLGGAGGTGGSGRIIVYTW